MVLFHYHCPFACSSIFLIYVSLSIYMLFLVEIEEMFKICVFHVYKCMEVNAGIHVCLVLWEKLNCIDICRNYNFSRTLLLSQSLCCFIGKEIIIAKPTLPWIENTGTDGGLQNLRIKANSLRMPMQTFIQTMDLVILGSLLWFSFITAVLV